MSCSVCQVNNTGPNPIPILFFITIILLPLADFALLLYVIYKLKKIEKAMKHCELQH